MRRLSPARPSRPSAPRVLATLLAILAGALAGPAAAQAQAARIMPVGDSITEGWNVPGGYRIALEDLLIADGYEFDLVGSQANGPLELADRDHEGHPGWRIDQVAARIDGWLATQRPDVVLLLLGTNDVLQNRGDTDLFPLPTAPERLDALIGSISATTPSAAVLVATVPPLSSAVATSTRDARARAFNAELPAIVAGHRLAGRDVTLVDMHPALSASEHLADYIHPNAEGYARMAAVWHAALRAKLTLPPVPPPAPEPSAGIPAPEPPAETPLPQPPAGSPTPTDPGPPVLPPAAIKSGAPDSREDAAPALLARSALRADGRGVIRVSLTCPPGRARCEGRLRLSTASGRRLATRDYDVAAGHHATLRLRLDRHGLAELRRRQSLRVVLRATDAADGGRSSVTTRLVRAG